MNRPTLPYTLEHLSGCNFVVQRLLLGLGVLTSQWRCYVHSIVCHTCVLTCLSLNEYWLIDWRWHCAVSVCLRIYSMGLRALCVMRYAWPTRATPDEGVVLRHRIAGLFLVIDTSCGRISYIFSANTRRSRPYISVDSFRNTWSTDMHPEAPHTSSAGQASAGLSRPDRSFLLTVRKMVAQRMSL